jgi:phage-related protein
MKKTQKTPQGEIGQAKRNLADYRERDKNKDGDKDDEDE